MFIILNMLEQYVVVKAIQMLVSQPNKSFSVRGFAKASGISAGAAGAALEYMKKKGIATLEVVGKTHQYKANLENALCRQWKILFNIDLIEDSGLVREITKQIKDVQSILLYGSFAHGTNDEKSDIDILVIAHKTARIDPKITDKLSREANISIMPLNEWKKKAAENKVFYENVIYDSVVLYGQRPVVL